jgi:histidine triad (HIT) family protein
MSEKIDRGGYEAESRPCPFCEIKEGRAEASFIARTGDAFAIMAYEGHPLVIPNNHITSENLESNIDSLAAAYKLAITIKPAVMEALGAQGITLVENFGEAAGQDVPHVHIHMLDRKKGDRKVSYKDLDIRLSREVLDARAERIKAKISGSSIPG